MIGALRNHHGLDGARQAMRNPRGSRRAVRRRGMTLLEVTLAMGLLVILTSMTYWFYASALETRKSETETARKLRLARVMLDRIAGEIRQASAISAAGRVGIRGEAERIWLSSLRLPTKDMTLRTSLSDDPPPPQTDLIKIEYKIARHPDIVDADGYEMALGLARVEISVPRKDSAESGAAFADQRVVAGDTGAGEDQGTDPALSDDAFYDDADPSAGEADLGPDINWEELYAREIRFLRFCYFDGKTWWADWDIKGETTLPQLVMVTVGFEGSPPFGEEFGAREENRFCECMNEDPVDCDRLPRDQFSTVVRIPQADPLFRSRVGRETQAVLDELDDTSQGDEEEAP